MLLLDEEAFALIKQFSGVDVAAAMRDNVQGFVFTLEITRGLILTGCLAEDSRLTLDKVSEFVSPENYTSFHVPIVTAIARGLDLPYQPN